MKTRTSKSFRPGRAGFVLIVVLLGLMAGSIGLAALMPRRVYTVEQEQWLADNASRRVNQLAPEVNYSLIYNSPGDKTAAPKPAALGARESHITADMDVRYRDKEGATVTAYDLRFVATYVIANPDVQTASTVEMSFAFPQTAAVLSDVAFTVDGSEPAGVTFTMQSIQWKATLEPGQARTVEVCYRAEGVGSFAYGVPQSQRMKDFDLQVTIRGAREISVPEAALAPTARQDAPDKTALNWRYANTITNRSVQVELPARPRLAFAQRVEQLGPFFIQLAVAAPLLTGMFLVFWFAIVKIESLQVTHESTVLLGIGFFLFYPLFIFLAGFADLSLAFAIAVIVAGALVVGYGVRLLGSRRVTIYLAPLLAVFYGLLTRGLTEPRYLGLMLVISAVLLAGLFMWRHGRRRRAEPAAPWPIGEATPVEPVQEAEQAAPVAQGADAPVSQPVATERYCVHCGQRAAGDFRFCPQCGQSAQVTRRCAGCGLEYIPSGDVPSFCPACGMKQ